MDTALHPTPDPGDVISTLWWVLVGVVAWLAVAAFVGVLIGRVIRQRDEQVPAFDDPADGTDRPAAAPGESRVPGRGSRPSR